MCPPSSEVNVPHTFTPIRPIKAQTFSVSGLGRVGDSFDPARDIQGVLVCIGLGEIARDIRNMPTLIFTNHASDAPRVHFSGDLDPQLRLPVQTMRTPPAAMQMQYFPSRIFFITPQANVGDPWSVPVLTFCLGWVRVCMLNVPMYCTYIDFVIEYYRPRHILFSGMVAVVSYYRL